MSTKFHGVYLRKDYMENEITDPLGPFIKKSNIGSSGSSFIECNNIDLSHGRYAELSARFGETDKYITLRIQHDIIFMILSAEERQGIQPGFVR
ncbi:MAG: hypothetical protein ABW168_02200 [Sedimenticola sp.]